MSARLTSAAWCPSAGGVVGPRCLLFLDGAAWGGNSTVKKSDQHSADVRVEDGDPDPVAKCEKRAGRRWCSRIRARHACMLWHDQPANPYRLRGYPEVPSDLRSIDEAQAARGAPLAPASTDPDWLDARDRGLLAHDLEHRVPQSETSSLRMGRSRLCVANQRGRSWRRACEAPIVGFVNTK